jgi:ribonuclease HI
MALTAKYATVCGVCGGEIAPGSSIDSLPSARGARARWAHADCAPGALFPDPDAAPTAAPAPSASTTLPAASATLSGGGAALEVWTDGACSGNPGPGGWAWATRDGKQDSGGAPHTTNQRMEIQAALEAVTALSGPLVVVSDSTYVVNCFRDEWWRGWLARGWTTSAKKPVANRELWEPLVEIVRERGDIAFRWVKGHSGDQMNDLVDALAVAAAAAQPR